MMDSRSIYLYILILLLVKCKVQSSCPYETLQDSCTCRHISDEQRKIPVNLVDCARSDFQYVPNFLTDANYLDLSHNNITNLLQNNNNTNLLKLDLSYNQIEEMSQTFFQNFARLEVLILKHNNLDILDFDVFQDLKSLIHLDLSFNNIHIIGINIFLPLQKLNNLDISYNQLPLAQDLIDTLGLNPNISYLELNNVGLKEISNKYFAKFTNLKHLSLSDNHFESVPNVPYSVQYLDLSGSDISTLQAKNLNYHSLKVLKLNRMKKLQSINNYAFYNLLALEELSISDCPKLYEFHELVFGALFKQTVMPLKRLTLSGNSLKSLNFTYKYIFNKMEHVDLTNNPWTCDCDLLWLQEVDHLYKDYNLQCTRPSYLRTKGITQLTENDLRKCHPETFGKTTHRILIPILILAVIILSALVGYLIYYNPNWHRARYGQVGPESPYNPSTNT